MVDECKSNTSIIMYDDTTYSTKRKDADKLRRLYDLGVSDDAKQKILDLQNKLHTTGVKPFIVFKREYKEIVEKKYGELLAKY